MPFNFKNLQSVKFLRARHFSTSPVTCQIGFHKNFVKFGNGRKIFIRSDVVEFMKLRKNAPVLIISHRLFHQGNIFYCFSVKFIFTFNKFKSWKYFNFGFSEREQLNHPGSKPDMKAWIGFACGSLSMAIGAIIVIYKLKIIINTSDRAKLYEQIKNGEVIFFLF